MEKQVLNRSVRHSHRLVSPGRDNSVGRPVSQKASTKCTTSLPFSLARRNDPVYAQLTELCLVTAHFTDDYLRNRYEAVVSLLEDISLIQKLYQGCRLDVAEGNEWLLARAMDLNAHLIDNANFGAYSSSEKINILFGLRRALEILLNRYLRS